VLVDKAPYTIKGERESQGINMSVFLPLAIDFVNLIQNLMKDTCSIVKAFILQFILPLVIKQVKEKQLVT
jgi:hypothetical protein